MIALLYFTKAPSVEPVNGASAGHGLVRFAGAGMGGNGLL